MLTRKGLFAGSKGSNATEPTNSYQHPDTPETLKHDTQPSAQQDQQEQPEHPFSEGDVREALGFDRNDPNVTVSFKRVNRLDNLFSALFDRVTGGVTDPACPDAAVDMALHHDNDDEDSHYDNLLNEPQLEEVIEEVVGELESAVAKHRRPFHSAHEGYAVLKEEVDELWDAIKTDSHAAMRKEAIQVAAMAIRFLLDVDPD